MNNNLIPQGFIRAERKNGVIKQIGVLNSALDSIEDFSADSVIKKDTKGIAFFTNLATQKAVFLPLSKNESLIELCNLVDTLTLTNLPLPPLVAGVPNPLDPNYLSQLEMYKNINQFVLSVKILMRSII